ncbi:hypothetical protein CAC42_2908 [Sphaceloma murrayae]|uniref:Uncharacterized protein n=1 Tax=Sphaceloma murrayae TaxID=2082308 RepID=A0A2K1R0F6_9PEZI|nr:hypothetical protein CAC42_2908 [Sphaceloma murrayae]
MTSRAEGPALGPISTNTRQTWQSKSSTSSATRYALDAEDHSPILVYRWNDSSAIEKSTQSELVQDLERNRALRVTKMAIPKRTSYVEIKRHDLFMEHEREKYRHFPNYDSSLASIRLPSNVYWSRNLLNAYDKLYIVSPEMSPSSSPSSSFTDTHGSDNAHYGGPSADLGLGAERD